MHVSEEDTQILTIDEAQETEAVSAFDRGWWQGYSAAEAEYQEEVERLKREADMMEARYDVLLVQLRDLLRSKTDIEELMP